MPAAQWYNVHIDSPPAGTVGETLATITSGSLHVDSAFDPDGDGTATVYAESQADAIRTAVTGGVVVNLSAVSLPTATYNFNPNTSTTNTNLVPFDLVPTIPPPPPTSPPPTGPTQWKLWLEDLSATPNLSDWDYNDFFWTISVSIGTAPNSLPLAFSDTASTYRNTAVTINPLDNDTDSDDDPLTITSVGIAAHGAVAIASDGKSLVYTPAQDFSGEDTFAYTLSDGRGGTATSSVALSVDYSALQAGDDFAATAQGTPITIRVTGNDAVPSNTPATVAIVTGPANGTATVAPSGTVTYQPDAGFSGTDTFTYSLTDAHGESVLGNVAVTVNGSPSTGEVTGTVWDDDNEDGQLTLGEAFTPGIEVNLYRGDDFTLVATATTDASGAYHFPTAALTAGDYRLRFIDPVGRDVRTPRGDNWTDPFALVPGGLFEVKARRQPVKAPATPFTTILRAQLEADPKAGGGWDANKDGKIDEAEIDRLMKQTGTDEIKGEKAAALAQLKSFIATTASSALDANAKGGAVSLKTISEYERIAALTDVPETGEVRDKFVLVATVEADFVERKQRLTTILTNTSMLAEGGEISTSGLLVTYRIPNKDGVIDQTKIKQGLAGDCSFLATTIAMLSANKARGAAQVDPQVTISQDLTPAVAGTDAEYLVNFTGQKYQVKISKPTQSQIALYATAGNNGLWLSFLEKAYAQVKKDRGDIDYKHFFAGFVTVHGLSR